MKSKLIIAFLIIIDYALIYPAIATPHHAFYISLIIGLSIVIGRLALKLRGKK